MLTSYDGELRIRPRAEDDILIDESAIVSLALSTDEDGKSLFEDSQTRTGLILLLVTAASLSLLCHPAISLTSSAHLEHAII